MLSKAEFQMQKLLEAKNPIVEKLFLTVLFLITFLYPLSGLVRSRDGSRLSPNTQACISLPSPNIQSSKVRYIKVQLFRNILTSNTISDMYLRFVSRIFFFDRPGSSYILEFLFIFVVYGNSITFLTKNFGFEF